MRKLIIICILLFISCSEEDSKGFDCGCTPTTVYDEDAEDLTAVVSLRQCEFFDTNLQIFFDESDFAEMPVDIALRNSREQGCD